MISGYHHFRKPPFYGFQTAVSGLATLASPQQDLIYIPMAMASSGKVGAEAVFSWMQAQYERIYEMTLGRGFVEEPVVEIMMDQVVKPCETPMFLGALEIGKLLKRV